MAKKPASKPASKPRQKWPINVYSSHAELEQADREYWWSRTPYQRLRALEELRQLNFGYGAYGNGKPDPSSKR